VICINPNDERFILKGKKSDCTYLWSSDPNIEDEYDIEFGTGCLKVTPAHDMNDKLEKTQLEIIDIFNEDAQ
jgi:valyl-tRNA synthetase